MFYSNPFRGVLFGACLALRRTFVGSCRDLSVFMNVCLQLWKAESACREPLGGTGGGRGAILEGRSK